jgi:DNA-directed RNA polymerase III subunit RPC2
MKQHIESFDYLINVDMKSIVRAQVNQFVYSEQDSNFYLKYLDIRVGMPKITEDCITTEIIPNTCRLRSMTYSADILYFLLTL